MGTKPTPPPDTIEPQSPPETPPMPAEPVPGRPDEVHPPVPDFDRPERSPEELPKP